MTYESTYIYQCADIEKLSKVSASTLSCIFFPNTISKMIRNTLTEVILIWLIEYIFMSVKSVICFLDSLSYLLE